MAENEQIDRKPYEQLPGEPDGWYSKFTYYCVLGSQRTMLDVYRVHRKRKGITGEIGNLPGGWKKEIHGFRWLERVDAWDVDQYRAIKGELESKMACLREAARDYQSESPMPPFVSSADARILALQKELETARRLIALLETENEQLRG